MATKARSALRRWALSGFVVCFSMTAYGQNLSRLAYGQNLSQLAYGQKLEGRYGPEFTFTHDGTSPGEAGQNRMYAAAQRHLITGQPEGSKFKIIDKYTLQSPDGWWFKITLNPGVLEIAMSPLTVEETRRFKDDIEDAVFTTAANCGFFPWDFLGGGHLNVSNEIFGGDVLLARNFLADFWNHNELTMGIFGYDTNNAYPFAFYKPQTQRWIAKIFERAGQGFYPEGPAGITRFFRDVYSVLSQSNGPGSWSPTVQFKHHDLTVGKPGRMEIRSVRPQKNMDTWLRQIELIDARINYLRRFRRPLALKRRVPIHSDLRFDRADAASSTYVPPVDPFLALRSFHEYLTESGLSWWDHKHYVWPEWQESIEMREFEASSGFRRRERRVRNQARGTRRSPCESFLFSENRAP